MTYATVMVNLALEHSNADLLQFAGNLAQRLDAHLIGIAASRPLPLMTGEAYADAGLYEEILNELAAEVAKVEAEFRGALQGRVKSVEWRSTTGTGALPDFLADEARSADLVIKSTVPGDQLDMTRAVDIGDLLMRLGRPLLLVPPGLSSPRLDRMLVAWKDTREARRALVDAMPLLRLAREVQVVEVVAQQDLARAHERVGDIVTWLGRHGIQATASASAGGGDHGAVLSAIATQWGADLIVAGAYGHSRLREWVLGGVTRELLLKSDRCALLSH